MSKKATDAAEGGTIHITRLRDEELDIAIEGLTPIIPHQWSEKARRMMPGAPDAVSGRMTKKGLRDPEGEAAACVYRLADGTPGVPATAFKSAMVSACRFFQRPTMTEAKLLFFVQGVGVQQLVGFEYDGEPFLREDMPRNANGSADLRYRYAFHPWRTILHVRFTPLSITAESVVALVDAAGRVGVGDWRPGSPKSATGTFGTFRVAEEG